MNNYRPFKVFIGRNVTANATGLDDLDNGEIVLLKEDGTTLMSAGETVTDSPTFRIAQGTGTLGAVKLSGVLQGRNITKWKGTSYAAATEQVAYVGDNGTTGSVEGGTLQDNTTYYLTIELLMQQDVFVPNRQNFHTFEFTTGTGTTVTTMCNNFITQINAHRYLSNYVTAVAVGATTGISLTGLAQTYSVIDGYHQVNFRVFINGGFTNATQIDINGYRYVSGAAGTTTNAVSVAADPGVGTYALVSDLERNAQGIEGVMNFTHFPVKDYPVYATSGTTYDVYMIEHTNTQNSSAAMMVDTYNRMEIICIPAGTGLGTAFEAVANPYFASTPGQFANVLL